ncbi:GNAT family N-acetyltransferase [Streptomyces mirabilis]|uniref:Acetyltransferase (GNAT) family protein n=1 Tax=Streptomyces mirabilis TaxID=68239 RepID=A0A1I2W0Z2_9ACTN|nr:GNAT family N-acetyltransferase [Streptomyces mirabilis]SFG94257.1 Acetyltransferase (GNAT) family protein [Streptomyces mirabilis]
MTLPLSPDSSVTVRPFRPEDEPGVRELIDGDRLPGQQRCTPERLAAARRGPLTLAGWSMWASARPRIGVLADAEDRPHGVISYVSWTDVHTGVICWLYTREHPRALRALLGHALADLAHCPQIEAFVGAPPGPLGPGGLPRARRAATHDALLQAGFTGRPQGVYLHCTLPSELTPAKLVADVFPCEFPPGHRLIIREAADPVAEAVVSVGPDRTATVYWIETRPTHRGRGLARKLLGQALALLADQGATEATLVIDNTPSRTAESEAASRLFHSFGFTLVDQLWTYRRRHRRDPQPIA